MHSSKKGTAMEKKRRKSQMLLPTIFMGTLVLVCLGIALYRGEGEHVEGARTGAKMLVQVIPLLLCAFFLAGMLQALVPKEWIARWVGTDSGLGGIFLGAFAGSLTPGGPFVNLPIAMGLFRSGASVGCIVAFLTGWSLWAVNRIPMEVA
jgi:hypothetical protein